jgi:hypothetical protein
METLIITLIWFVISIICYYINKEINVRKYKNNETWCWEDVRVNIVFSILIPLTVGYWIYVICSKLPKLPEQPPKWL